MISCKLLFLVFLLTGFFSFSIIPSSFAALEASVIIASGTRVLGCEKTNQCFIPYSVTIDVGDKVLWTIEDTVAYTVTSEHPSDADSVGAMFDMYLLPVDTLTITFGPGAGTYPYLKN